jgi:7-cyano-7-deazaguanine tRNA-ribosyltransferase
VEKSPFQNSKINSSLKYQFIHLRLDKLLENIKLQISRKTRRIKGIFKITDNKTELLFSFRPNDGRFLPSLIAGELILQSRYSQSRVIIDEEAIPFVKNGKSVFCKYIIQADDNIYPGSEVFILDIKLNLIAIGTATQPSFALLELNSGIGVKTKHYK